MTRVEPARPASGDRPTARMLVAGILAAVVAGLTVVPSAPAAAGPSAPGGSTPSPVPPGKHRATQARPAHPAGPPPHVRKPPAGAAALPALRDGYGSDPAQDAAMRAAAAKARSTGTVVVVDALTTETQQVVAQPKGGFVLTGNPQPVRTRAGGGWTPVDTTLHRNADGMLAPAATAYGTVTFSGGGTGPLVTTRSGATSFALSWPSPLPTPIVIGSRATYPEVLPGVDLILAATVSGGFSEVLVVKNPQAAKNTALAALTLPSRLSGGRYTAAKTAGGVSVTGDGGRVLDSSTALMWDSATSTPRRTTKGTKADPKVKIAPDASDATHPGAAARIGIVTTVTTPGGLTLSPDKNLLGNPATVYPVYVDPTFNWHPTTGGNPAFDEVKQGSPCNGASYFNNTGSAGDYGRLAVGVNGWDSCFGIMRSYYQWQLPSAIWGAHISSATVNATELYSATCNTTAAVNLHWAGGIGPGTNWNNQPGYINGFTTSVNFEPSYNPTYCPKNGWVTHGFNVTGPIAQSASSHAGQFTVALAEDGYEHSHNDAGFKRFTDNPTLQIFYNRAPATPGQVQMTAVTGADNAACATATPYPYIGKTLATNTPVLSSQISDPDGDPLQATFKYWLDGSSTVNTGASGDNLASGSTAKYSLPAAFTGGLHNGQVVDWQVQVTDGMDASGWSPVCHFIAQPTAPSQPSIASVNNLYPDLDNGGGMGPAAGTPGQFTLANNGAAATQFAYRLDVQPALVNPPADQTVAVSNNTATVTITPPSPGPHTLWVAAIDVAGDASSMQAYRFEADRDPATTCASLAACFNNTAISPDSNPGLGAADGVKSFSATELGNAGWISGGNVTVNGASFTLPAFGAGQHDNVLAANQTITYNYPVPTDGPSALMFLATSTTASFTAPGTIAGNTTAPPVEAGYAVSGVYCFDSTNPSVYCAPSGTIRYTDGTTQAYYLTVPDWINGPEYTSAVFLPDTNSPTGQTRDYPAIFPLSVPLTAGKTIASVTLPDVSAKAAPTASALHIFAMTTRNTTTGTVEADGHIQPVSGGQTWTGAWASPSEDTQGSNNGTRFGNQTIRTAVKPSMSGNTLRIKLDNWWTTDPVAIGHVTVAVDAGSPSAATTGPTVDLTFSGATTVTIPQGTMVYSDPLTFPVKADQYLLVSYVIKNPVHWVDQHTFASRAHTYLSAAGAGDHTTDTAGTAFTDTEDGINERTFVLTDLDVTTSHIATQAVLGTGLVDTYYNNYSSSDGYVPLSDDLAGAQSTTPTVYGTIDEGIESNQITKTFSIDDYTTGDGDGGPSALARVDRDLLAQPGINTVILFEGLEDLLEGKQTGDALSAGYTQLITDLKQANINVVAYGVTGCDGYTGDSAFNDPCTTTVEANRTAVNGWLASGPLPDMTAWTSPGYFYLDPDPAIGTQHALATLDNFDQARLADEYLSPTDTWPLDDGATDPTTTLAGDTASNTRGPILVNNPAVGQNPATLTGGANWTTNPEPGSAGTDVLTLDGVTGAAVTNGPVIDTTKSFTVDAWVYLPALPTHNATIIAQDGPSNSAFTVQYIHTGTGTPGWAFSLQTGDPANPTATAYLTGGNAGYFHNLVGVYNATTKTAQLYFDGGDYIATTPVPSTITSTGPLTIGRGLSNGTPTDYLPGSVTDIRAWNYARAYYQIRM